MADNSVITEIASKQAYDELKFIIDGLGIATTKVAEFKKAAAEIKFPSEGKKFIKEANDQLARNNKLTKQAEEANERIRLKEIKLQQQREKAFDKYQSQIEKEKKARESQVKKESDLRQRLQRQREKEEATSKRAQANAEKEAKKQKELSRAYIQLRTRLNNAEKEYRDLAAELGVNARATRIARREVLQYRNALDSINQPIGRFNDNVGRYTSAVKGFISAFGVVGGVYLFASAIRDAGKTVIEFNKQLIAVGKTTNITGEELQKFGDSAINLGLQLNGISIKGLLETSEVAGQLGIKGSENILKFSKTIEQLRLTSDVAGEEGARNFAQFINVSSDSVQNADKLGSVITELGNNFATTESQILSNSTEIQKGISIYNTSAESVLALGAATNSLGNAAEVSRSAMQTTFAVIDNAVSSGEGLEEILRLTGLTQKELSRQFRTDATTVFKLFVKGLSDADKAGENLRNILVDLDIKEKRAIGVVGSLAKNYETLDEALERANDAYSENIALTDEANQSAQSLSSKIQDVSDSWDGFILSVENGTGPISNAFKSILGFTEELLEGLRLLSLSEEERRKFFDRSDGDVAYLNVQKEIRDNAKATGESIESLAQIKADDIASEIEALNRLQSTRKEEMDSIAEKIKSDKELLEIIEKTGVETERSELSIKRNIFANEAILRNRNKVWKDGNSLLEIRNKELEAAEDLQKDLSSTITKYTGEVENSNKKEEDNKKSLKGTKKTIKGTVEAYEQLIKKLQETQKNTANTSDKYNDFEEKIKEAKFQIDLLKTSFKELDDVGEDFNINDLLNADEELKLLQLEESDINEGLEALSVQVGENVSDLRKQFETFYEGDYDSFLDFSNLKIKKAEEETDRLKKEAEKRKKFALEVLDTTSNSLQVAGDIVSGAFDRRISLIDQEIEDTRRAREFELETFVGTTEQKEALAESFAQKEEQLRLRRVAEQRRQARFDKVLGITKAIIDTASAVTEALPNIPLSVLAGVTGAAQVALIASQPIPQYADGKKPTDSYTGKAIAGEVPNKTEYHLDKHGNLIGVYDTATLIDTKAGDTILKDTPSFQRYALDNSLMDSVLLNNTYLPQMIKLSDISKKSMDYDLLYHQVSKGVQNGLKNFKNINNIYISSDTWGSNSVNSKYKG